MAMVCNRALMISLPNLGDFDTVLDIKVARAVSRAASAKIDKEWEELQKNEEIDESFKCFLFNVLNAGRFREENKLKVEGDDVINECSVDGEIDPHYRLFLKQLKEHDKSYVLEYEEDNLPVVIKYEEGIALPEECDPNPREKVSGTMVPKTGYSSFWEDWRCDSVETVHRVRNELKQDKKFNSKMAKSQIRIEMSNLKDKRTTNERVFGDSYFHQNIKLEDEQFVDVRHCNAAVSDKLDRVRDQKKGMVRKLNTMMSGDIERLGQKPDLKKQRKHDPLPTAAGKNTNDLGPYKRKRMDDIVKVENVENLSCHLVLPPEYPHPNKSFKPGDDWDIYTCKDHSVANRKIQDQRKLGRNMNQEIGVSHQRFDEKQYRQSNKKTKVKGIETFGVEEQMHGKPSTSRKHNDRVSREMRRLQRQRKHELQPNPVRRTKKVPLQKPGSLDILRCSPNDVLKIRQEKFGSNYLKMSEEEEEEEKPLMNIPDPESRASYPNEGIIVCSNNFDEDTDENLKSVLQNDFREQVLAVLRKPFDKEEYLRHQQEIKVGDYTCYHPELGKKLARYRYKPGRRLTLLRGFFFWLQHISHEGAFRPWKDRECLAVEPIS